MLHRRVVAARGPVEAEFRAVPSKSDTHRALVAAALARGRSEIVRPLDATDTRRTLEGLGNLGLTVGDGEKAWFVEGRAGRVPGGGTLDCGASGTTCRLLTAMAALGEAPSRLVGDPRLRERPMAPLVDALRTLGATIAADPVFGGLPLTVGGRRAAGGAVSVPASSTSQFASGLLMIGPCLPSGLRLELQPKVVSRAYLEMTIGTMAAFGIAVLESPGGHVLAVAPGSYRARSYMIEGDWSAASYLLALPALLGGRVRLLGLARESRQPDARFATILAEGGLSVLHDGETVEVEGGPGLRAFDIEVSGCPDLVPTLAVVALVADGPCRLRGVSHLRLKESDRVAQLETNLRRLGASVRVEHDELVVDGRGGRETGTIVETASDHRIAMAFAVAGLRTDGVVIDDANCVAKSNPGFWSDFALVEAAGSRPQN